MIPSTLLPPDRVSLPAAVIGMLPLCVISVAFLVNFASIVEAQSRPAFLDDSTTYFWPTNASRYMSSSFGESRSSHFHAAIDIGTWGHEGHAVFAARDGIVHRVAVGPVGYGNVIYMRHDDGSTSVYAHLKDFHPGIRSIVDSLRLKDYSFEFDRNMEEYDIRFSRGQQIGWSGSTGVGPPHLHFELRTPEGRPFNPLLAGVHIDDTIPPQFSALAIEPLAAGSKIGGGTTIHRTRPSRHGGQYHFGTVDVQGEIGLAVDVFDRANASNNVHAVYELEMVVNDELYFHSRIDSFSYFKTRQMFLDRIYALWNTERNGFQRLYVRKGNTLPVYKETGHSGRLNLPPGTHDVLITATDFFGNSTRASLQLNVSGSDAEPVMSTLAFPDHYLNSQNKNSAITEIRTFSSQPNFISPGAVSGTPAQHSNSSGPDSNTPFAGTPREQEVQHSLTYPSEPPKNVQWNNNWIRPEEPVNPSPVGNRLAIRPLGSFSDELRLYSSSDRGLPLNIASRIELHKEDDSWILHRIDPAHPVSIYHENMKISVHFPVGSVYEPLSLGITGSYPDFTLFPDTEPFHRPAEVRITLDEELLKTQGLGIYKKHPRTGEYKHVSSRIDRQKNTLSGTVSDAGSYIVRADSIPPIVSNPDIGQWQHIDQHHVTVHTEDLLSGIDHQSVVFQVNGERGIAEYDPEKDLLRYRHPEFSPQKENEITVIVFDRAGNRTEKTFTGVPYN